VAASVPLIRDHTGADDFHFADWNAHAFYFYDSAGNIAECIARHTLSNARGGEFAGRHWLGVSEIGVAVEAVPASVETLTVALGVPVYQSGGVDFSPIGDEAGLFILVRRGRLWFPDTGQPAVPLPMRVAVHNAAGARFTVKVIPAESAEPQVSPHATSP
jgi:hypothetical protein